MAAFFLIFNHQFTPDQEADARRSLGVDRIVTLPPDLQECWSSIPPEVSDIRDCIEPIKRWLALGAKAGDYVLIQGDFGACYALVQHAFERGLIPVYSTTGREVIEEHQADGTITVIHQFKHVRFRRYGT